MKTYLLLVAVTVSFLSFGQMGTANFKTLSKSEITKIENKFTFNNLRLYPIRAKQAYHNAYKDLDSFVSLELALKKEYVTISEVSSSGNVNTLKIKNNSNYIIYGIAGEVIIGGKQDRILGQDIVIKPYEEKFVSAFCVERGRWRQASTGSNFKGYYNVTSNKVRKAAIVDKNQQKVWDKVAEVVEEQDTESSTGTYVALKDNNKFNQKKSAYINHFKDQWKNDKDVIGVIAVSGNEVMGCDIFATHQLFNNSYNNLLHAYTSEALTNGKPVNISYTKVQDYLKGFLDAKNPNNSKLEKKGNVFKYSGKQIHLSSF